MHTFVPMSWQWEPGGQSVVVEQGTVGVNGPTIQWRAPSTLGLLQPLPQEQSALSVQTMAQLPLPRHCWPAGQVAQATGCPQLLVQVPQRPAQVAPLGSGLQQVPP
jgi:hypothetical protein